MAWVDHWRTMAGSVPPPADQPSTTDSDTARAIRLAVYLTGGLVALAIGLSYVASAMEEVLNCLYQTDFCSGGFSESVYFNTVPILVSGAILIAVALVLFVLAHRSR